MPYLFRGLETAPAGISHLMQTGLPQMHKTQFLKGKGPCALKKQLINFFISFYQNRSDYEL